VIPQKYFRSVIQSIAFVIQNLSFGFIKTHGIYQGPVKHLCGPSLHCLSCPSAVMSCPVGMIQFFLANIRYGLKNNVYQFGGYVVGYLGIIGLAVGRMPCGWVCPFGWLQDLMGNNKLFKIRLPVWMREVKYGVLLIMVVLLPFIGLDLKGFEVIGTPWYCKYLCPAGTLEAGIPLALINPDIRSATGMLFFWKLEVLVVILSLVLFTNRFFCRVLCPLGAFYGIFNPISLYQQKVDYDKCTKCNACYRKCPMGLKIYETPKHHDCLRCLECKNVCKFGAVSYEFLGYRSSHEYPDKVSKAAANPQ